jgi:hypothetical protein
MSPRLALFGTFSSSTSPWTAMSTGRYAGIFPPTIASCRCGRLFAPSWSTPRRGSRDESRPRIGGCLPAVTAKRRAGDCATTSVLEAAKRPSRRTFQSTLERPLDGLGAGSSRRAAYGAAPQDGESGEIEPRLGSYFRARHPDQKSVNVHVNSGQQEVLSLACQPHARNFQVAPAGKQADEFARSQRNLLL